MEYKQDLKARTRDFALQIINLYTTLPKTTEAQVLGKQVLRSGTSVGAHYREACRAKSNADFISKHGRRVTGTGRNSVLAGASHTCKSCYCSEDTVPASWIWWIDCDFCNHGEKSESQTMNYPSSEKFLSCFSCESLTTYYAWFCRHLNNILILKNWQGKNFRTRLNTYKSNLTGNLASDDKSKSYLIDCKKKFNKVKFFWN